MRARSPDLVGQREQQTNSLVGHAMLGVVEVQAGGLDHQSLAALGVFVEHGFQVPAFNLIVMRLQSFPRGALIERNSFG